MDNKIMNVLRGAFIIVLGVLVAVCGVGTAVNVYFGVVSIVAGVLLIGLGIYTAAKKMPLAVSAFLLGAVLTTIAIALFIEKLSLAVLVTLLIYVIMGLGFGLAVLGIVTIVRRNLFYGIGEIVIGALLVVFTALYLGIPDFQKAFWIIVGILMIVLGVAVIIFSLVDKSGKKRK